jgi:hypothetical protein
MISYAEESFNPIPIQVDGRDPTIESPIYKAPINGVVI